jgi:membrane protease YdiL (CAAX protease family)
MTALLLLLSVPAIMWISQTVLLWRQGAPIRGAIDHGDMPAAVRTVARLVTQLALLGVILVYPLLRHESIIKYYGDLVPVNLAPQAICGLAASTLLLSLLYLAWVLTDQLQIDVHQSRRKWTRRLVLLVPTAAFGAFVEELLFRGVLLGDLLRDMPHSPWPAIGIGTAVFAVAHYVRRTKRRWTFPGHLMLGLLLCVAFVRTGSLWLPVGLHAGGILLIMGTRPFVRYRGPAWLTGASTFPFAGVVGLLGLTVLTAFVIGRYGVQ